MNLMTYYEHDRRSLKSSDKYYYVISNVSEVGRYPMLIADILNGFHFPIQTSKERFRARQVQQREAEIW